MRSEKDGIGLLAKLELVIIPFFMLKTVWLYITEGRFANAIFTLVCTCLLLCAYYGGFVLLRKFMGRDKKTKNAKPRHPNAVRLYTARGNIGIGRAACRRREKDVGR